MNKFKFTATPKLVGYLIKFALRLSALGGMIYLYFRDRNQFYTYTVTSVKSGVNFMHLMWAVYMGLMLLHLFPAKFLSMGAGKCRKCNFVPNDSYSESELLKFVHNENVKAWRCMLCWLAGLSVVGILYYIGILGDAELILLTGAFFVCDYICILIFCPFQTFGQKSRCCVNCRIYDWGHFFMFTPMLFIDTFYSRSLFYMGTTVLIHWEYMWTKHPERFWYGSNQTLSCNKCADKTCQIKESVRKLIKK